MEETMIERVAWAILGGLSPDASHEDSLAVARAAMEAMREPTEAMEVAGFAALHDAQSPFGSADGCYRAMIGAALAGVERPACIPQIGDPLTEDERGAAQPFRPWTGPLLAVDNGVAAVPAPKEPA